MKPNPWACTRRQFASAVLAGAAAAAPRPTAQDRRRIRLGFDNYSIRNIKPDFWKPYPKARASEFAEFVALAKRGAPRPPWRLAEGKDPKSARQEFQKAELERSLKYCRETLGLGVREA